MSAQLIGTLSNLSCVSVFHKRIEYSLQLSRTTVQMKGGLLYTLQSLVFTLVKHI